MKFGMLDSEWEHKKEAALQYLIQAAEEKRTVYYHELANQLWPKGGQSYWFRFIGHFLGEVWTEAEEQGYGPLTCLVLRKDLAMPSGGFFIEARERGYDVKDFRAFFVEQRDRVWRLAAEKKAAAEAG